MKSDKIRFKILKILKDFPTHGYNLYLLLSEEGLVNNASELYKYLRSLKKKGLLIGQDSKSPQGPNRTILSLTTKGLDEYYSRVIESANIFIELMMEANLSTIMNSLIEGTHKFNLDIQKINNKKIYIDSFQLAHRFQSKLIHKLLIQLKKKNKVYLRGEVINTDELLFFKDRLLDIKLLDENLSINPHMMDIIFAFGYSSKKSFEKRVKELLEILKDNGFLFLFFRRRENLKEPKIYKVFINDLLKNLPEKHHKKISEIIPFVHLTETPETPMTDSEIKEILLKYFENVELSTFPAFISIVLAKNPRN